MSKKVMFINKINFRILTMLLVLFTITAVIVNLFNRNNIRHMYEANFTERVLLTNALMATIIDSEDVSYFVELIKNQDYEFKQRQIQFYHDRNELRELYNAGVNEEKQKELLNRLTAFYSELAVYKTGKYWNIVDQLNHLKEVSRSTYLYVMADIGLVNNNGDVLYVFIFDADDNAEAYNSHDLDISLYTDGLGTSDINLDSITTVYSSKKQMDWVEYYNDVYGELYFAYAPIFNIDGDVIAVLGTDLDLGNMNIAISKSVFFYNMLFLALFVMIIILIFIFLQRSIIEPLRSLTNTARELAQGNVYSPISEKALKQRSEIRTLADAINDMSFTYQEMISSTAKLFEAANTGKLAVRNDAEKFKGDIKNVIKQINDTLDSMTLYLNSIPESIFIMNKDLDIYFRNDHFFNNFGNMPASEFLSNVFLQDRQNEINMQDRQKYLKEHISRVLYQPNNNTTVWINDLCFSIIFKEIVLSDEMSKNSVLIVAIDITDLMNEKENAQAAAKAKSDFLSRMSHEMRTPMNAIIGMTKISATTVDVSKLKHCLSTIGISSGHLLGIINDVLDMAKIEAGKFELENLPVNIEKTLMKVCNIVIDNMEKKNQKFNVILSKDLHLHYIADDLRLSQVVTNLLSNAVKFTPEGGKISLTVESAGQEDIMDTLRFSVSDNGIGMTSEQIARLFNAFEQADGSVSRKFGGTGLGLAISKSIVEKMGGRIWVESEPGAGSTFIFEVNLERAPHQDTVIFDGIRPEDIKLLIVENDDDVRKRFLSITERFGIRADSAASVDETLVLVDTAASKGHQYDIVFLDYDMPGTNGIDFVNQISGMIEKNTVIIITTYLKWHHIEKLMLENNVTRYITKPLFPSSVLDAVNDVVGNTLKSLDIKTSKTEKAPDLSGVNIMLAEDVEINREIFLALLEETHISVDIAENGLIAVEKFSKNPDKYDLIIMDIQMPEMDGYQATRTIRAYEEELEKNDAANFAEGETRRNPRKRIPIIAMTANAFKEDIERCLQSGMNDHLPKPIDEKSVIEKIIHYIKHDTDR